MYGQLGAHTCNDNIIVVDRDWIPTMTGPFLDHGWRPQSSCWLTLGKQKDDCEESGDEDADGTETQEPGSPLAWSLDALDQEGHGYLASCNGHDAAGPGDDAESAGIGSLFGA